MKKFLFSLRQKIILLLGISENEKRRPSNASSLIIYSNPICQQRPWLLLVEDHPRFPQHIPEHPARLDYLRSWELFARGLTLEAPGRFSDFIKRWERGELGPRVRHWRTAGISKAILLVRKFLLWKRY